MRVFICTSVQSRDRSESSVRRRVEELAQRLTDKGHEPVSHLDASVSGRWPEMVGADIALMLDCDGILLDNTRKSCRVCSVIEAVARSITWKPFVVFHTAEEFRYIKDRFVI